MRRKCVQPLCRDTVMHADRYCGLPAVLVVSRRAVGRPFSDGPITETDVETDIRASATFDDKKKKQNDTSFKHMKPLLTIE